MKFTLLLLSIFLLQGCDKGTSDEPTVFSGVVLFADTMEPAGNVELIFVATESDFPRDNFVETIRFRTPLDTPDGAFEVRFDGDSNIDLITIGAIVFGEDILQWRNLSRFWIR